MLKVRVIPTLLWKNFGLVKGIGFDSWRRVGPVLPAIKVYNQREVDELILVDIVALNVLWVAASIFLLFSEAIAPNMLGIAFVCAQALAVALFAELQFVGLRRAAAA